MPDERTCPHHPPGSALSLPPDPGSTAPGGRTSDPHATTPGDTAPPTDRHEAVTVPGYEVRGELARGGMGRVLEAFDPVFGREVAVKLILPGPGAEATAGRFVRESRITGRLTHPNIPPAYHLGELPDGSPFLAMKLVRGRTLAALLAERPDPGHDLPRFVGVVEQVCQAVGYAHARGVVHRDLKPANVMVGEFGEVQVMDWGLAFENDDGGRTEDEPRAESGPCSVSSSVLPPSSLTQAGAVMGTPAYMAPEQARGEPVDARADVFALGGLLTSVLAGRPPFAGESVGGTLVMAAAADTAGVLAALSDHGADAELVGVARACIAAAAADRPTDGTAVAGLLAAYRAGVEERLRTAERERAAAEGRAAEEANTRREAEAKVAEQRKRRRAQLAAAAAAVVLVAGAGAAAAWRVQDVADKKAEAVRLENDAADRKARGADAVAGLLDQAKAALEAGDAARAAPPLAAAEQRAKDDAIGEHADRLASYRTALTHLRALDTVDDSRWTPSGSGLPAAAEVAEKWAGAFRGIGIVPGVTPPAEAAARVNGSPIRVAFLTALHEWQARAHSKPLREILDAADPDSFRSQVRHTLTKLDRAGFAALVDRAEWDDQPAWLAACATSPVVPPADRRRLLERLVRRRPTDFGLMMYLGGTFPQDTAAGAGERARWFQAAVALRPGSVPAWLALGTALRDARDAAGAEAAYREVIRLDPTFSAGHNNLGLVLGDKGDEAAADAEYREAIRLNPKEASARYNLGNVLGKRGELAGAEAAYREAVRADPKFAPAHTNLGVVLADKGDTAGAEAEYREAIRLDPTKAAPRANLGKILAGKGDGAAAEAEFREAIRLDPGYAVAHYNLGSILGGRGDLVGAEAAFREAIRLDPKDAATHTNLGVVLGRKGDAAGAEAEYREAIRLDPKYAKTHYNLGNVLRDKGDAAGAEAAYREAVRLDPKDARAHFGLGLALKKKGDAGGAEAAFRGAARADPTFAAPHTNLGAIYWGRRDAAGAEAAYREAIRLDPKEPAAYVGLGLVCEGGLQLDRAEAAYREAGRLAPRSATPLALLGDVLRKQGRHADAVASFRAALAIDPNIGFARNGLAYCLRVLRGEVPTAPPPRPVVRP